MYTNTIELIEKIQQKINNHHIYSDTAIIVIDEDGVESVIDSIEVGDDIVEIHVSKI